MKHSSLLRRAMLLAYGAVVIFALMIMLIYRIVSPQLFAQNKIDDLIPKGQIIASYIENTLNGEISTSYLMPLIGRSSSQWEATVWVVDTEGQTLMRTQISNGRTVGKLPKALANSMLPSVLEGKVSTHFGDMNALETTKETDTRSIIPSHFFFSTFDMNADANANEETVSGNFVAVAVPISFSSEVVGAVFMIQSMSEVMGSMQVLTNTITLSLLFVALLLLPLIYWVAARMARPLLAMRDVAMTMASGNLSIRASENGKDEYGELGHALNYLSTELGNTISSLELERNRLKNMIDGLSEGIIALDENHGVQLSNPAASKLLKLGTESVDLRSSVPEVFSLLDQAMDQNTMVRQILWIGDTAISVAAAPLLSQSQTVHGCVGILSDVTSAERLEQTRRDYVANVSHELRTPLTAMRALMEPLRDGMIKDENQKMQVYDVVLRETMRLSRLVNDMLELSRLQSGTASMAISTFDVKPLLELIRETYSPYADDYMQTFIYDVPETLPPVTGNPDRTQQVLVALLDNAFKYTPEEGTVTLRAEVMDGYIDISVSDTGIGISEEDLPHVFDRFYKVDKSHHSKGTGLGLAIAYEIMKTLGENMTVTSSQGKGSTFRFTLHLA